MNAVNSPILKGSLLALFTILWLCINSESLEKKYPTQEELETLKRKITEGTISDLYYTSDRLYRLPREQWPEQLRKLLHLIVNRHISVQDSIRSIQKVDYGDPKFKRAWIGEYAGNLVEMVSAQKDERFIPFLKRNLGGGTLVSRALANIGEPAFDVVIEGLYQDGLSSQVDAVKALELMLRAHNSLTQDSLKHDKVQRALLHAGRSQNHKVRQYAVSSLQFFPTHTTIFLIDSLRLYDSYSFRGKFPVRAQAQHVFESLKLQIETLDSTP